MSSGYTLGSRSLKNLQGVDERLVAVVKAAILTTKQDFTVAEGLRSPEQQRLYVSRGVSKTMHSKHLTGRAVDLVPWIGGGPRWEWPAIYPIAVAMRTAALDAGMRIVWGGVWDRVLNDLEPTEQDLRWAVLEYQTRHAGPDFLDGPHYELAG